MKKISIVLCFILLLGARVQAQNEETITMLRLRLGVEAGMECFFGDVNKPAMIRESRSYNYNYGYYFGLRPEYSLNRRFAVSAGLRYAFYNVTLYSGDHDVTLFSGEDYFLWKVSENGINTNYLTINNISQKKYYVGIPLEVKFFPCELDYFVRNYFVAGTVLNLLVTSTNDVTFQNAEMEKYASVVSAQMGKPNRFLGYIYAGVGLKIGRTNYPFGNIEIHFPIYTYGQNKSNSLTNMKDTFGIGIQATLQIPICRKRQLTYKVITD